MKIDIICMLLANSEHSPCRDSVRICFYHVVWEDIVLLLSESVNFFYHIFQFCKIGKVPISGYKMLYLNEICFLYISKWHATIIAYWGAQSVCLSTHFNSHMTQESPVKFGVQVYINLYHMGIRDWNPGPWQPGFAWET